MTKFVGTPLRGVDFSSVSDEAVSARVNGDTHPRLRIDAGGRITWSSGEATGDTNLSRTSENLLFTDDAFQAALGVITLTTAGVPSTALPDGALAVDTTNTKLYFRSNSLWNEISSGLLSGDADGGNVFAQPFEAEITNHVIIDFDGGLV